MTEQDLKIAFAEEWLRRPNQPFEAAMIVTYRNAVLSLQICDKWTCDPEIDAIKRQLVKEHGEEHFLPTQASIVQDILGRAQNCIDPDNYVKLMRLVADIRGMIQKPGVTINNTVTTNKVMVVPIRVGSDGNTIDSYEWEKQLIKQQSVLTANG